MPVWQQTLVGIALHHIETLECSSVLDGDTTLRTTLADAFNEVVSSQPWYFRWGIKTYAFGLGSVCWAINWQHLSALPMVQRQAFLRRVRILPFFGLIEIFAQSTAFLNVFDYLALAERLPSSAQ